MSDQQTLDGSREAFNPLAHGLNRWVVNRTGKEPSIDHGAWLRAVAEHSLVGTCRSCGEGLRPDPATDRGNGVFDYSATCVNELRSTVSGGVRQVSGCGKSMLAPRGRVLYRSSLASERPATEPS